MQFFFDESGKSDMKSSEKSRQPNLIIAGLLVPWESNFWIDVWAAWENAAELLKRGPNEIELHGWELYGGKGQWSSAPNALPVLQIIFSALKKHNIPVYWTGLPVEKIATIHEKPFERILITYLNCLHEKISMLEFENPVEVYGDEGLVAPGKAFTKDEWQTFADKQAKFASSACIHGIQLADIIAHTLYRSNKITLSNTDTTATEFRASITGQIRHVV